MEEDQLSEMPQYYGLADAMLITLKDNKNYFLYVTWKSAILYGC